MNRRVQDAVIFLSVVSIVTGGLATLEAQDGVSPKLAMEFRTAHVLTGVVAGIGALLLRRGLA
jgi:hypothetical protein